MVLNNDKKEKQTHSKIEEYASGLTPQPGGWFHKWKAVKSI